MSGLRVAGLVLLASCSSVAEAPAPGSGKVGVAEGETAAIVSAVEKPARRLLLLTFGDTAPRQTPIASSETVVASRDGRWIARMRGRELQVAPSTDLSASRTTARIGSHEGTIFDAVFSPDGSGLAFLTAILPEDEDEKIGLAVHVVLRDGTGLEKVLDYEAKLELPDVAPPLFLVAYDSAAGRVYWIENLSEDELSGDLVAADVRTGLVARRLRDVATDVFTPDFSKMYWADGGRVFEAGVDGAGKRLLFDAGGPSGEEASSVEGLLLTPDGKTLIVELHQPTLARTSIFSVTIAGGARRVLLQDVPCDGWADTISPDGRSLWIGSEDCAPSILDLETGRTSELPLRKAVELWALIAA